MKDRTSERKKLIIEGNAFYELDLDCVRCQEERQKAQAEEIRKEQRKRKRHDVPEEK